MRFPLRHKDGTISYLDITRLPTGRFLRLKLSRPRKSERDGLIIGTQIAQAIYDEVRHPCAIVTCKLSTAGRWCTTHSRKARRRMVRLRNKKRAGKLESEMPKGATPSASLITASGRTNTGHRKILPPLVHSVPAVTPIASSGVTTAGRNRCEPNCGLVPEISVGAAKSEPLAREV